MRNNNGTLLRAKSSVVQGKVRNAALQSILLNYWSGEKQKANMKTRITYNFYFKSAACCKSNTKHKHLLVKMVLKCYFCWTIILSYEHLHPCSSTITLLLTPAQTPETSSLCYGLLPEYSGLTPVIG